MKHPFSRFFGLGDKEEQQKKDTDSEQSNVKDTTNEEIKQIEVANIIPNRYQPRTIFNEEKIEELARTIHTHGIIQPIIVRKIENGQFEIIAGERRFRAVKLLEWKTVPAIIKDFNDTETASVALIENLQREELSPIEEAMAYYQLIDLHHLTQEALAQRLGKGQSTIANKLRLLKLPQEIQDGILEKEITERHARALMPLKDPKLQIQLFKDIIEKKLNVKQTEERVAKLLNKTKRKPKPRRVAFSKDMRIAVNTIRQSLSMVSDSGIQLDSEEKELDDCYQITIRIPKNK